MSKIDTPGQANLNELFQLAFASHQAGDLGRASQIYGEILSLNPNHFDALHLSGLAAAQSGFPEKAVELIGKAIVLNNQVSGAFKNLGIALQQLGRFDEAGVSPLSEATPVVNLPLCSTFACS
jgi:tetratricopeptide (TPR) repeat protein